MDKLDCVIAARAVLKDPNKYVILDTETTGLYPCEIVQIAIIDLSGKTLLNTLVKPTRKIESGAAAIHGITENTVANAPTFKEIYEQVKSIINHKTVLIYNASFDSPTLDLCCSVYGLSMFEYNEFCIMELYSEFVGEWNDYFGSNKWQKLPGGDHSALGDCLATLEVIKYIAQTSVDDTKLAARQAEDIIPF